MILKQFESSYRFRNGVDADNNSKTSSGKANFETLICLNTTPDGAVLKSTENNKAATAPPSACYISRKGDIQFLIYFRYFKLEGKRVEIGSSAYCICQLRSNVLLLIFKANKMAMIFFMFNRRKLYPFTNEILLV